MMVPYAIGDSMAKVATLFKDHNLMPEQNGSNESALDVIHSRRAAEAKRRATLFRTIARKMASDEKLSETEITELTAALDAGHIEEAALKSAAAEYAKFEKQLHFAASKLKLATTLKPKADNARPRIPKLKQELTELQEIVRQADAYAQTAGAVISDLNRMASGRPELFADCDVRTMVSRLANDPTGPKSAA